MLTCGFAMQSLLYTFIFFSVREKDSLWQKTDRLAHQHRLHMTEKWMDGSTVTNCLGCNSEFSFTLRKVHVICLAGSGLLSERYM